MTKIFKTQRRIILETHFTEDEEMSFMDLRKRTAYFNLVYSIVLIIFINYKFVNAYK